MSDAAVLAGLYMIRTNPMYQAAEALRRKTAGGAAAMARAPAGSEEHRAILLLLNTWETMARMVQSVGEKEVQERIYETVPISYMYRELRPAIEALRGGAPAFGLQFEKLTDAADTWCKARPDCYISGASGGLHAFFG